MLSSASSRWIVAGWLLFVGGYALGPVFIHDKHQLMAFGNIGQCIVPFFATAGLLLNATSPHWRRNAFWMLMALGISLWLAGQLLWTYVEVFQQRLVPNPFLGDVIFFLHTVPMMGALSLRPHARRPDANLRFGYLDFMLLLLWWVYLYAFIVLPWQFVHFDEQRYGFSYNVVYWIENLVVVVGLAVFGLQTTGRWRTVYLHLASASLLYNLGSLTINLAIDRHAYMTGGFMDLPLVASFVWLGSAGIMARGLAPPSEPPVIEVPGKAETLWPARLAMMAILSMPVLAFWTVFSSEAPENVRQFRLVITLAAIVVFTSLLFFRQQMVDRERLRLLRSSQEALDNLKRLQTQFVQSEKLASLGQLAAGAAHEINNPLTAILGYADLLIDDRSLSDRPRSMVEKIREQARRTKTLLGNLLSFARQTPADKTLIDINPVVANAVQLRTLDLRGKNIHINLQADTVLPAVRCDSNQMLQVFFNIISNAVDAMEGVGGGSLTVRSMRERDRVVIEFSDTGPGIKQLECVFDPFYTTKPVGKGTGLGLSICYGIVSEHGGSISCYNRHQGGATFRVELPAITAVLPKAAVVQPARPRAH